MAGVANEFEDGAKLGIGELQLRIGGSTTYREDSEDAPTRHAFAEKVVTDVG